MLILEKALRNTTAFISALQRVYFIELAAHSFKQKLQSDYNESRQKERWAHMNTVIYMCTYILK